MCYFQLLLLLPRSWLYHAWILFLSITLHHHYCDSQLVFAGHHSGVRKPLALHERAGFYIQPAGEDSF